MNSEYHLALHSISVICSSTGSLIHLFPTAPLSAGSAHSFPERIQSIFTSATIAFILPFQYACTVILF